MKYSLLALSALVLSGLLGPAYGQTVATPIGSTGAPQVAAYQTSTGTWRKPLPVSLICTGGVACNYLTQANASSTYLPLTGGTLSGTVSTQRIVVTTGDVFLAGGGSVLLTSGGRTGAYFSTNSFGDLVINTAITGGGGIRIIPTVFASLPAGPPAGSIHFCSDCYIGSGAKGINVVYNGSAWTGGSGETVSH